MRMVNREVGEFAGKGEMEGKVVEGLQMWRGEEEDGGWPEMEMDVEEKMEMMVVRRSGGGGGGGGLRTTASR